MDRNRRADRPRSRSHADDTRLNHEVSEPDCFFSITQRDSVQPTEVIWNGQRKIDLTVGSDIHFSDHFFFALESIAADTASRISPPDELKLTTAGETFSSEHRTCSD